MSKATHIPASSSITIAFWSLLFRSFEEKWQHTMANMTANKTAIVFELNFSKNTSHKKILNKVPQVPGANLINPTPNKVDT